VFSRYHTEPLGAVVSIEGYDRAQIVAELDSSSTKGSAAESAFFDLFELPDEAEEFIEMAGHEHTVPEGDERWPWLLHFATHGTPPGGGPGSSGAKASRLSSSRGSPSSGVTKASSPSPLDSFEEDLI